VPLNPAQQNNMPEQLIVKCPSCRSDIRAIDESWLVDSLRQHQYERHAVEMPPERVREDVAAQLRDFDGYNARPISGA
jgi:hypothetical protein